MPIFHRTPANQTVRPADEFEWIGQELERRAGIGNRTRQALEKLLNRHKRQNPLDYTQDEDLQALERELFNQINQNRLSDRAKRAVRKIFLCSRSSGNHSSGASVHSTHSGFSFGFAIRPAARTRATRQQPNGPSQSRGHY